MTLKSSDIFKAIEKGVSSTWLRHKDGEYGEYETQVFEEDSAANAMIDILRKHGIEIEMDQKTSQHIRTFEIA